MEAYSSFAQIYDLFMKDVNYNDWIQYIKKIWNIYGQNPKLIADLGCGTGNISISLAKQGYEMIGIDISEDMLSYAREKTLKQKLDILYLLQDMREFELYGTVDCIVSLFDSINYIIQEDDLLKVFKLVNNYLEPKGLFIFDINTQYKFNNILSSNTFAETTEYAAYIWENFYNKEQNINEYYMNFFIKQRSGLYERFEEIHYQKSYSIDKIKSIIDKSGLKLLNVYDAFTFNKPSKNSERVYFVSQEISKI